MTTKARTPADLSEIGACSHSLSVPQTVLFCPFYGVTPLPSAVTPHGSHHLSHDPGFCRKLAAAAAAHRWSSGDTASRADRRRRGRRYGDSSCRGARTDCREAAAAGSRAAGDLGSVGQVAAMAATAGQPARLGRRVGTPGRCRRRRAAGSGWPIAGWLTAGPGGRSPRPATRRGRWATRSRRPVDQVAPASSPATKGSVPML